tara:strand:+ start:120 stop:293 length:174 start_codon:yes stop_codon:yes gene_type:complete
MGGECLQKEKLQSLLSDFDATVKIALAEGTSVDAKWIVELHDLRMAIADVIDGRALD